MSATQMYPSLWGGFYWFNVHEDRQGADYNCYSLLYQFSSWLIYPLGKSIIVVIGESPTTILNIYIYNIYIYMYFLNKYIYSYTF